MRGEGGEGGEGEEEKMRKKKCGDVKKEGEPQEKEQQKSFDKGEKRGE